MRWGNRVVAVGVLFSCCMAALSQSSSSVSVTNITGQLSSNTSACSPSSDPGGNQPYCFAYFNGSSTNSSDTGAETLMPDPRAGHVSDVNIKTLLYPGFTGRVICEYQPWFGASNHKSIGYSENSAATVAAQDSFMLAVGCDVNLIDFYGALDLNQSFNLATTNAVFSDLSTRAGYPLKFGIMEDKNALTYTCSPSSTNESATVSCVENALITEMDYVNTHYASSGAYLTDNGNPLIFSFVTQETWPVLTGTDWNTIWSAVKAHTDTYTAPFKYILEFGSFTSASWDNGRYAWMQPPKYSSTQQFWWGSVTSLSPTYLDNFYSAGVAHPSQIAVGGLWKGFDDNNASWSGNRIIAQQCGQVWLDTAHEIAKYFGGSNPQLPYVQVATWNDYEEGTEVETGIDNCYTVNATISASQLTWSLAASDSYASLSTVHHFTAYYADSAGNLNVAASNLPPSTTSLDLSSIVPNGAWTIYVEMVGQPLIINRMSNGVAFTKGAVASLAPTTVAFGNQAVGTSSAATNVVLTNTGNASMSLNSITVSGDFTETNNCPASLAPSASCSISVTFSPSAAGTRTGSLQVSDSDSSSPQVVSLSGTGTAAIASLTPNSLSFGNQGVGTSSMATNVVLGNTGSAAMNIYGISIAGDFKETDNCPASLAPSAVCSVSVIFSPTVSGARTGSLQVSDSAASSPQTVSLAGTGVVSSISFAPSSLTFTSQPVGTTSGTQTVTLTNTGTGTLNISGISLGGDFSLLSTTCSGAISPSGSCTFNIAFKPTATGLRTASAVVTSDAPGTNSLALTGRGADFGISAAPNAQIVPAGGVATYTIALPSAGAPFGNSISLSCNGLPADTTCAFSPGSATADSSPTLTISTQATRTVASRSSNPVALYATWLQVSGFGFVGLVFAGFGKRRQIRTFVLPAVFLALGFSLGCGGGVQTPPASNSTIAGTPTGTYTVAVVGTSGTLSHSANLTLTVK